MLKLPDESRARLLTFERALPGCIIVNQAGRRYMNEACAYDLAGRMMIECDRPAAGTTPSYFCSIRNFAAATRRSAASGSAALASSEGR